jgi:hypothetical protein
MIVLPVFAAVVRWRGYYKGCDDDEDFEDVQWVRGSVQVILESDHDPSLM